MGKGHTGRFAQWPHYLPEELDSECETVVSEFLLGRYGRLQYPISTDDLTVLIEMVVEDLDLYADLSEEDGEIEGVTDFFPGRRPKVRVSKRLRSCSTALRPVSMFGPTSSQVSNKCKRDNMPTHQWCFKLASDSLRLLHSCGSARM
jgi:hypothetical protein